MVLISGGQTGVDRAVLDIAQQLGVPVAGWCPSGRVAEDGPLPYRYPLRATPSADTAQRTIWNVHLSDALIVLNDGWSSPGSELAVRAARWLKRPVWLQCTEGRPDKAVDWMRMRNLNAVNVAGPRQSEAQHIYESACAWLERFVSSYRAAIASTS